MPARRRRRSWRSRRACSLPAARTGAMAAPVRAPGPPARPGAPARPASAGWNGSPSAGSQPAHPTHRRPPAVGNRPPGQTAGFRARPSQESWRTSSCSACYGQPTRPGKDRPSPPDGVTPAVTRLAASRRASDRIVRRRSRPPRPGSGQPHSGRPVPAPPVSRSSSPLRRAVIARGDPGQPGQRFIQREGRSSYLLPSYASTQKTSTQWIVYQQER